MPYFVNQGDTIRVDTRTGDYVTRVLGLKPLAAINNPTRLQRPRQGTLS